MKALLGLALALSALNLHSQLPDYVSPIGLVSWYGLNGDAMDDSGNAYDGVVNGALPAEDRFGTKSGAMLFDNSSIDMANSANFALNSFTVSAWFNTSSAVEGYQSIFSHFSQGDGSGYYGYWLGLLGDNGDLFLAANSWVDVTNGTALNDGAWHMITGVYNYANASLYIDGQLVNSTSFGMSLTSCETAIGNDYLDEAFFGILDDIGVWNRPLSACEVDMLYYSAENPWDVSVSQIDNTLMAGQEGASYQWVECTNYTAIEGATFQEFSPPANGDYAVMINMANCVYTSECYSVTGVGIDNIEAQTLSVYPVPSIDQVQIQMPPHVSRMTVQNALGQQVFSTLVSSGSFNLGMKDLESKGWYTVQAYDQAGLLVGKARVVFQ